jgi:hypothetical protein
MSAEGVARRAAAQRGLKRRPDTCAKIAGALTGKKLSPEHCAAIGNARRGKPLVKMRGPLHPFWKGGEDERDGHEYKGNYILDYLRA